MAEWKPGKVPSEGPSDPLTSLAGAAVTMHELYLSLLSAGFTVDQAFELVKAMAVASAQITPPAKPK